MPPRKPDVKQHPKSAKAAEQKFGKSARKAAEAGGKKPVIWQKAERPVKRLPGSVPLAPARDVFEPRPETFTSDVSHAIEGSPSEIFRAFNDPLRRGWCHEAFAVRGSVAPRSLTLGLTQDAFARVSILRKGGTRCTVQVVQTGCTSAASANSARMAWTASLARLAAMIAE